MRSTKAKLTRATELAEERATQWCVYMTDSKGNVLTSWRIVTAPSSEKALKRVRRGYAARPILPSSEWYRINQEVGL